MSVDHYTYRVTWSADDGEYVGLCAEFPSLSWLAKTPEAALRGIRGSSRKRWPTCRLPARRFPCRWRKSTTAASSVSHSTAGASCLGDGGRRARRQPESTGERKTGGLKRNSSILEIVAILRGINTLFSLIESPYHPNFTALYQRLGIAAETKVIVFAQRSDEAHVEKLAALFPVHAVLTYPVAEQEMQAVLQGEAE